MNLKIPPLLLTVIFLLLMWGIAFLFPELTLSIPGHIFIAFIIATIGSSICVLGVASFRSADTTVNPTKPHQASTLVIRGIFRVSRNPMYLGFLLLLIAWGVYLSHTISLLIMPPLFVIYMNIFQITHEEDALYKKFGEAFISYKNSVRRWL